MLERPPDMGPHAICQLNLSHYKMHLTHFTYSRFPLYISSYSKSGDCLLDGVGGLPTLKVFL